MTSKNKYKNDFEDQLESAYQHTINEIGTENIKLSLKNDFENIQKAHDAIHEYLDIAYLSIPSAVSTTQWHKKSAFITYHWEVFHHAHRSFIEALCTYYNVAFILLRTSFELLIKGAFWECLSHTTFRENSRVLDDDKEGKKIKNWLNSMINKEPNIEKKLDKISASIYDKIEGQAVKNKFRVSAKTIINQLDQWCIFQPIKKVEAKIYKEIYVRLSADVHVRPNKTDIGRRLNAESSDLFKQEPLPDTLFEYTDLLCKLMDLAIVIELNILTKGFINEYKEIKKNLNKRQNILEQLELKYSLKRIKQFLG